MLRGDNDLKFILKHYDPTQEEAIEDFLYLYGRLKNGIYGLGEDPQEDFEDWDDDFMFAVRTLYYSIFENPDKEQREKLLRMFTGLVVKRVKLIQELG